ncbi:hypothetical protein RBU61_18340 [Tissierella sp. MB52-C2]|uniref:hypothetical protein n=1 Tax=Tissierella sp. MB52-C2 TaxID=3070999 RepID=UPI00280B225C|nr:hypothetical protein [Tissierella sp. MB52-C2]WMM24862.1 hypothetical protein RBU61_18340 [Tissierella sp. MB52-C2]
MFYISNKGSFISLSYVLLYLEQIKYFTVSEEGVLTCNEDGNNPRFKEWIYSDEIQYQTFLEALKPYKIKKFSPREWFMRSEVSDRFKNQYFYRVLVYEFNETTKHILLNNTSNVVFRDKENNLLYLPQDLCFFDKEGKLLMGTLSHEDIAAIMVTRPLDNNELLKYGLFPTGKQVVIPDLDCINL